MTRQRFRNSRLRRSARRRLRRPPPFPYFGRPHQKAIYRLALELKAREGLLGAFHGGVGWRATHRLVQIGERVHVELEKSLRIDGKRYVPDLIIRRHEEGPILFVVEVWHTHPVTPRKRQTFNSAGVPWIEVKSWHVLARRRRQVLPVLDWGGPEFPSAPLQGDLLLHAAAQLPRATPTRELPILDHSRADAREAKAMRGVAAN